MTKNTYESPFNARYSSDAMQSIFSPDTKFKTWRKLWIALAEAQKELGLNISDEQINDMIKAQDTIDYEAAAQYESKFRHDVMAHVHEFGDHCPSAKGIIHLGATSCYVGDNTDVIIMRDALKLIRTELVKVVSELSDFAMRYRTMPTLGFTHFQPAQTVTVGKRASLWIQDLLMDLEELNFVIDSLKLLGSKGTTGTQASFMAIFENDHHKVKKLEELICEKMAFDSCFTVTGQTYPRKQDSRVINVLSSIAQSAYKFSNDLRLLQNLKEIEEPFEKNQIGSSAMAYKRNPMRSERISSLARYVIIDSLNPAITASTQWFERTLDDSANKRISIPEAFLAVDAILNIYANICSGLVVYPKVIEKRLMSELPFMATENIMMEAVKRGGDRQELHELIRKHSMEAGEQVKVHGLDNDLIQRIANDEKFGLTLEELQSVLKPENYIGRCPEQVEEFIQTFVKPVLKEYAVDDIGYSMKV